MLKLLSWNITRRAKAWRCLPDSGCDIALLQEATVPPATSTRQLDFVFTSTGLTGQIRAKAVNDPGNWGPSDHCRIEIDLE